MFTVCSNCGFMFDNEAGACPQCGNGAMPQSPDTSAPENKAKEKKLGNLFNNFKKKKSSRDVSTKEAFSDTNDTLATPKAPIFNSTEQNIEENTIPAPTYNGGVDNVDDYTINASTQYTNTAPQEAIQELQDNIPTVSVFNDKGSSETLSEVTTTHEELTISNTDILEADFPELSDAEGEITIASNPLSDDTPTVSAPRIQNDMEEPDAVITIDKSSDNEIINDEYKNTEEKLEDVSSSSFPVSSSTETENDVEVTESVISNYEPVDTTYTIINDTVIKQSTEAQQYASPVAPIQPLPIDTPTGYTPVAVTPMVYSTPEVTAPKNSSKLPIIILVSLLLGIVVVGGVILALI